MQHLTPRRAALGILFFALFLIALSASAQRRGRGGADVDAFRFRFVGPLDGNRVASIAGVPGDVNTYYAGAASGGIFKSVDGGFGWTPIFDSQPVAAIGALAVAPSDPSVVWAGTGEAWAIRDIDVMGDGIYKSTDAGQDLAAHGPRETGRIGRIVIASHESRYRVRVRAGPHDRPQQERGVYRTTDGGEHWERVLFVDENTGCCGLDAWTRKIRACCSPERGRWKCTPTANSAAARAAACTFRATAATTWTRIDRARTAANRRWARSMWRSRPPIRIASTR